MEHIGKNYIVPISNSQGRGNYIDKSSANSVDHTILRVQNTYIVQCSSYSLTYPIIYYGN